VFATRELKEPFRSTDCECGHGQFKGWSVEQRNALMTELVTIIRRYRLGGFASIVPIADYQAVFPNAREFDPYYLAVTHTMVNMAVIGVRGIEPVKLWFEDNAASVQTYKIYRDLRDVRTWSGAARLEGIDFGSKNLCPLQAADLVAREAFKHMDNLGTRPTRIPITRLADRLVFILWNKETLGYLRDNGGPENYDLLTSWGNPKWPKIPNMKQFWKNF
jgi:hypothetical protein